MFFANRLMTTRLLIATESTRRQHAIGEDGMRALGFWSLDGSGTIRTVGGRALLVVSLLLCPAMSNAQHIVRDDTHVKNASATNFRDAERLIVGDFGKYTSFIRFDLSMLPIDVTGNEIQKATLRLFIGQVGRAGSFEVSRVHGDWNEATLSFDSAVGIVGNIEAIVGVAAEHADEYLLVDLTALVKEWVDGTQPNDGVALVPVGDVNLQFDSKEAKGTSHDPRLEIVLSSPETANGVTSVTADSPLLVTNPTTTPRISLGTVPVALGGTGLTTPGAAGSLLRSDGSAWTSAPLSAPDIPPGSAFYIRNDTSPQPASFNIAGIGAADMFNAATQFSLGGNRVLSAAGTNNLFAGFGAGAGITTGTGNAFFGQQAGQANSGGSNNSFFGVNAGPVNTTGFQLSFFGRDAGASNTTGSFNSFFGRSAGFSNTTGLGNSFFGQDAGFFNTSGETNAFFGNSSGRSNTTGSNNAFFGTFAGFANTTGGTNAFFGRAAGLSNTTAGGNSFFGDFAGAANTTGGGNAFFGAQAGLSNDTGFANAFFGASAGSANTTGFQNAFFGGGSGRGSTTGRGNTFIGSGAGFDVIDATGDINTLLGVGTQVTSGVNQSTAIGAFARVTQSNSVVLGLPAPSGPNVGIGTGAPQTKLHLVGKLYVDASGQGVVLKAPSGACFELTVTNAGALTTTAVACP
jgi:hypothetical protein